MWLKRPTPPATVGVGFPPSHPPHLLDGRTGHIEQHSQAAHPLPRPPVGVIWQYAPLRASARVNWGQSSPAIHPPSPITGEGRQGGHARSRSPFGSIDFAPPLKAIANQCRAARLGGHGEAAAG